jgi:hypothetical protein
MGRFSPTVTPTWGASLGNALSGGVDAFLEARRQKQQQEDQMFGRGYRVATADDLQPATQPPAPIPASTHETNAAIVRGVQPTGPASLNEPPGVLTGQAGAGALGGPSPLPGRPAQSGTPSVAPEVLARALSLHVTSGQPLTAPSAQPQQPSPQQVGQQLAPRGHPVTLGGRQWMRTDESQAAMETAASERALKDALTHSEIFKNAAQGQKDLREPRDVPIRQEHVVDPITGRITFFDPTKPPADLRINPVPRPSAEVGGAMKFGADQKNKIIDDFRADTKKFEDVRAGWEVLTGALKEPSLATPFALADAYARISNPGALVRPTTMEMIENLGSLDQRFKKFASHNINGQLPPEITADLVRTIGSMVKEHATTYNAQRGMAIKRGAQLGIRDIDPVIPTFEYTDPMTAVKKGAGGGGHQEHVQTIDEMIRAGATDAQIRAAVQRGAH